jgi:hypothetical protein
MERLLFEMDEEAEVPCATASPTDKKETVRILGSSASSNE